MVGLWLALSVPGKVPALIPVCIFSQFPPTVQKQTQHALLHTTVHLEENLAHILDQCSDELPNVAREGTLVRLEQTKQRPAYVKVCGPCGA